MLLGHSIGGLIVLELAQQLGRAAEQGGPPELLALGVPKQASGSCTTHTGALRGGASCPMPHASRLPPAPDIHFPAVGCPILGTLPPGVQVWVLDSRVLPMAADHPMLGEVQGLLSAILSVPQPMPSPDDMTRAVAAFLASLGAPGGRHAGPGAGGRAGSDTLAEEW